MQFIPRGLRPLVWRFIPAMYKLQKTVAEARRIVEPEVQSRRKARQEALAKGEKIPKKLDALDWIEEHSAGEQNYDVAGGQLTITFAAIHTTSMTLSYLLYDIISVPGLIDELRKEVVEAYTEDGGWQKTTLFKLKLMDSVMKESQRVNILTARKSAAEDFDYSLNSH